MRALRWSIALILVGLLAIPQAADARGGGGGGGDFHTAHRPGFVRHQQGARFANRRFFPNQRFANNVQNGVLAWGGWGWGDNWHNDGYGYQPVQDAPPQAQVIVIHSDGNGRMTTAEAAADYGYVQGCHAIPNGYHCDTATPTR